VPRAYVEPDAEVPWFGHGGRRLHAPDVHHGREQAREMALVCQAARERDVQQRRSQQRLDTLHAAFVTRALIVPALAGAGERGNLHGVTAAECGLDGADAGGDADDRLSRGS
jgi:hypothetical protein